MRQINRQGSGPRWVVTAMVAAAVALTVAGCGQPQVGAAALYGKQRISAAQLSDQVANLNAGRLALKVGTQPRYTTAQMPGLVLSWYLRFATVQRSAAQAGVTVSPHEVQVALGCVRAQVAQQGATLREAEILSGLPPDLEPSLGRWFATQNKLAGQPMCPHQAMTPAAQSALTHKECLAAKSLNIRVNPQFGTYDYGQLSVVAAPDTLSAPGTVAKGASPSPAPQLTPRC